MEKNYLLLSSNSIALHFVPLQCELQVKEVRLLIACINFNSTYRYFHRSEEITF